MSTPPGQARPHINVSLIASVFAAYTLKRRYLRGIGLHFVSIDLTIRRGYRRTAGRRPVLRKAAKL